VTSSLKWPDVRARHPRAASPGAARANDAPWAIVAHELIPRLHR